MSDALEKVADDRDVAEEVEVDVGHAIDVRGDSVGVDRGEEVAGQAEREKVDRKTTHDLVGAEVNGEHSVDEREESSEDHRHEEPNDPAPAPHSPPNAEEGSGEHHPLETDVYDARTLRKDAADRSEHERGGET